MGSVFGTDSMLGKSCCWDDVTEQMFVWSMVVTF